MCCGSTANSQLCLLTTLCTVLQILDQGISAAGIPYSYGFAIILLTILVKLATYPLSKQQVSCIFMMFHTAHCCPFGLVVMMLGRVCRTLFNCIRFTPNLSTTAVCNMQVESTVAMQNIAPRVKAIQEEYKGRDQQEMQIKVGQLYKEAGINPLAGCLPTLATLPVWIGLYR